MAEHKTNFIFNSILTVFLITAVYALPQPVFGMAEIPGCTDPLANNFDPDATLNDGSCTYNSATITFTERKELSAVVDETSGLIVWQNKFWTHNDDTDLNIYGFTFEEPLELQPIELTGLSNIDWEELTQDAHYLYMGDFGNNLGNRTNLKIYKIEKLGLLRGEVNVEEIAFSYDDQVNFNPGGSLITDYDAEAFIVTDDFIYIFTKQWTARQTSVYRLPNTAGTHVAENIGTFDVEGLVTGSVYLPEERLIALIGYNFPEVAAPFIWLLYDFEGDDFFSGNKRRLDFNFLAFVAHQLEAITTVDGLIYYATNEFASTTNPFPITIPQRIHKLDLTSFLAGYLDALPVAETYFYRGFGDLDDLSNWATNPNGSGRIPTTFATDNVSWHIVSPDTLTLADPLPVSGANARVILGDGTFPVHLIAEAEITGVLYLSENSSVHFNGVQPPAFGQIADNSSVGITGVNGLSLNESSFWNLSITGSSFAAADPARTLSIRGDLVLENSSAQTADGLQVVFDGTGEQALTATPSWAFSRMTVDKATGTLEIAPGSQLRIASLLNLQQGQLSGSSAITIASEGSVWDDGGLAPTLTFEREISSPDFSGGNLGHWVGLASPVAAPYAGTGGLLEPLWTQGFPGANENLPGGSPSVLLYTAQTGEPVYTPPAANMMTLGTGFFAFLLENNPPGDSSSPVDFSQPLRVSGTAPWLDGSGEYAFGSLNAPDTGESAGWNLLGNPLAAWLNWEDAAAWQPQQISRFAWVWNPLTMQYRLMEQDGGAPIPDISTDPLIAPFQAFWVRSTADGPQLGFSRDAITLERNAEQLFDEPAAEPFIRLTFESEGMSANAAVRFAERYAADDEVRSFNAPALWPASANFSYIALKEEGRQTPLMLLSREAELTDALSASVFTYGIVNGEMSGGPAEISWTLQEDLPESWQLSLTHTASGTVINLREQNSYIFEQTGGRYLQQSIAAPDFFPNEGSDLPAFTLTIQPEGGTSAGPDSEKPKLAALHQNYPNPFNPETRIRYTLPESAEIRLTVYDSLGRRVAVVAEGHHTAGSHTAVFRSGSLSSGLYFYELRTPTATLVRKMTILK